MMIKKKLLNLAAASIVSAGIAGFSAAANANNMQAPGLYIGAQGGYAQNDYFVDFHNATYATPGGTTTTSKTEDGFAARGFLGINFNPYFAVEGGYMYLPDNDYKINFTSGNTTDSEKIRIKTDAWDILGKITLPISDMTNMASPWSVYAKGGMAYVNTSADAYFNGTKIASSNEDNNWLPEGVLGTAVKLSNNMSLDISYMHIFGDKDKPNQPNVDAGFLGLTYNF